MSFDFGRTSELNTSKRWSTYDIVIYELCVRSNCIMVLMTMKYQMTSDRSNLTPLLSGNAKGVEIQVLL